MNKWMKQSTNGTSQSKGKTDWVGGHFEKAKAAHAATLSVKIMSCRSFTKPGALYNVHDLSTSPFASCVPCWPTFCVVQPCTDGLEARLSCVAVPVPASTCVNARHVKIYPENKLNMLVIM